MTSPRGALPIVSADRNSPGRPRPVLILASESPRRLALLRQAGIDPDAVRAAQLDETPRKGELPHVCAMRLAEAKAKAILEISREKDALILAADTVVALGRRMLPKAEKDEDVRDCLARLSGRRHRVVTAVVVAAQTGGVRRRSVTTSVALRRLTADEIESYVACREGIGKAGGYGIQGRAETFVRLINGSYSNVVGLPLAESVALLRGCRFPC